jgi:hypothetical protein
MAPEQVLVEGRDILDSYPVTMTANIWLVQGFHLHMAERS